MSDFREQALKYHAEPKPGKISIEISKPAETVKDLALAYSPVSYTHLTLPTTPYV